MWPSTITTTQKLLQIYLKNTRHNLKVIAARSKAKAKPQKRETAELPSAIPMNKRKWIDIEP